MSHTPNEINKKCNLVNSTTPHQKFIGWMIYFAQKLVSVFEIRVALGQKCSTAWFYAAA
jgi:hypothetical protein